MYVISNLASPDGSVQLASYSPTGSHKVTSLAGLGNNATLAVSPSGTPNVGTVYAYRPSSKVVAEITPDGTVSRHDLGSDVSDLQIAPTGTPNAGTVYVADGGDNNVTIINPDGTTSQVDVSAPPAELTVVPGGINGTGTVYVTTNAACDCADPAAVAVIDRGNSVHVVSAGPYPTPVVICTNGPYAGDGYLLTGDKSAPGGLLRITPTGEMTTVAQTAQTGRIEAAPASSTIDGTIYAAYNSDGITIIHPDGTLSTFHPTIPGAIQIDVTPTGIPGDGTIYIFAATSSAFSRLDSPGTKPLSMRAWRRQL